MSVALQGTVGAGTVRAQVFDASANPVGTVLEAPVAPAQSEVSLMRVFPNVETWSAETPRLYRLQVTLEQGSQTAHQVIDTIGFRTVEVNRAMAFI